MAKLANKIITGHEFSEYPQAVATVRAVAHDSAIPVAVSPVNMKSVTNNEFPSTQAPNVVIENLIINFVLPPSNNNGEDK